MFVVVVLRWEMLGDAQLESHFTEESQGWGVKGEFVVLNEDKPGQMHC